jgi:phage terminase large subunit-like protein
MKLCENELKHRFINYNQNPVDKFCLKNAGIYVDKYGQCMCIKKETAKRIDGAVTLIILYEMYRRYRSEFRRLTDNGNI